MLTQPSTPVPIRLAKRALAGIIIVSSAAVASATLNKGLQFAYQVDVNTSLSRAVAAAAPAKAHAAEIEKEKEQEKKKEEAKKKAAAGPYFIVPAKGIDWGIIHSNNGVDIANSCGTAIKAAAAGTVIEVSGGWNGGYGNAVGIRHGNGTVTYYAHLQTIAVESGEKVSQGEKIGTMGQTGQSTGCHLHFEVHGGRNPFGK